MNKNLVRNLVLYIVGELSDMEAPISTIRIIKLLYLIDLSHIEMIGSTLTGIDWIKYHYGPYFLTWPELQRSMAIDLEAKEVKTERGAGWTFRNLEEVDISRFVKGSDLGIINRTLKAFAHQNLDDLLRAVYDTLPIRYGVHDQPLDFSYETDHFLLKTERLLDDDVVTIAELTRKYGNPFE